MTTAPRLIDIRELAARLSISRTSIYRLIAEDASFPRPVRVGARRIAFVEEEADAYIAAGLRSVLPSRKERQAMRGKAGATPSTSFASEPHHRGGAAGGVWVRPSRSDQSDCISNVTQNGAAAEAAPRVPDAVQARIGA